MSKKYEISEQILNNIVYFLKKTTLTGEEVPAYNEIFVCLSSPIQEENQETTQKQDFVAK
jgi:hypothetical protein